MSEWIPVSDRLPELEREVLITLDQNSKDPANYGVGIAYYDGKSWNYDKYPWDGNVIAWMVLPAPYKGEQYE